MFWIARVDLCILGPPPLFVGQREVALLGVLFGYGYIVWAFAAIVFFFFIFGITPMSGDVTESIHPVAHWGQPLRCVCENDPCLHTMCNAPYQLPCPPRTFRFNVFSTHKNAGQLMMAAPLIIFQVSSVHSFERQRIQGYGFMRLPVSADLGNRGHNLASRGRFQVRARGLFRRWCEPTKRSAIRGASAGDLRRPAADEQ